MRCQCDRGVKTEGCKKDRKCTEALPELRASTRERKKKTGETVTENLSLSCVTNTFFAVTKLLVTGGRFGQDVFYAVSVGVGGVGGWGWNR